MSLVRLALRVAAGLTLVLALAACAGGTASPGSTVGSGAGTVVEVKALEYKFEPAAITVPAGEVTFRVTNAGTIEHELEIFQGDKVVDEVEDIVPGVTRDLRVTLAAGEYTLVCGLAGHEEAGMKGTLTVTGG